MSAAARRKGKVFEQQIRAWLDQHPQLTVTGKAHAGESEPDAIVEFRAVEAPAYPGDESDLWTCRLVVECKNQSQNPDLPGWWRQAKDQQLEHDSVAWPFLIHKRHGVADPAKQWVTMPLGEIVELLLAVAQ